MTACHNLAMDGEGATVVVDLLAGGDGSEDRALEDRSFEARVTTRDPVHDLAVLRASHPLPETVTGFAATDTMPVNAGVVVVGVSEIKDDPYQYRFLEAEGNWRGGTLREDEGVLLGRMSSPEVLRGMSGAPVCRRADGLVAGVVSARYNTADGWLRDTVWVIRTEYLTRLIGDTAPVTLLDVSEAAVAWRQRRDSFLTAVASLARSMPDALLVAGHGPPLIDVDIRYSKPANEPALEPGPGQRSSEGTKRGSRGDRIPAAGMLTAAGDCWLLGGPGAGKSRLLRSWAAGLADRGSSSAETTPAAGAPLPVLVRATDLAAYAASPLGLRQPPDALADAVNAGFRSAGQDGFGWLAELFTSAPADCTGWLLLVDGLDEVSGQLSRNRVLTLLTTVAARMSGGCRVVVASRSAFDAAGGPGERFELAAMTDAQRDELVGRWFADLGLPDPAGAAAGFAAELDRRGMRGLARIPLMLVILAQLFAYQRDATLPASRVEAYERIVEEINRRNLPSDSGPSASVASALRQRLGGLDGLISRLAYERFRGRARDAVTWLSAETDELRLTTGQSAAQWRIRVREAVIRSTMLVADGDDFVFVHATLEEFFAARHLARDRQLSHVLRRLMFGRRASRLPFDGTADWYTADWYTPSWWFRSLAATLEFSPEDEQSIPFADWVLACWHDWPKLTTTLLRAVRRDRLTACAFVAFLAWRSVRLSPRLRSGVQAHLTGVLTHPERAGRRDQDSERAWEIRLTAAGLLAMTGDQAGCDVLAQAAADPELGLDRLRAARNLIALGDLRGQDLLAEAVAATIPLGQDDLDLPEDWLAAAEQLARSGDRRAATTFKALLEDRPHGVVYNRLTNPYSHDPNSADVAAILLTELPPGDDDWERSCRAVAVRQLADMTDAGSAVRLVKLAEASGTIPGHLRMRAAERLTELGDHRVAGALAELAGGDGGAERPAGREDTRLRLRAAWDLARLGDMRAVRALLALADDEGDHVVMWDGEAKTLVRAGNPDTLDVLAAVAADPDLPSPYRCAIVEWLALSGDHRGIELAAEQAADPQAASWSLLRLADALARHGDRRFADLLAVWATRLAADRDGRERAWAARVLAAPEAVLRGGLYADRATAPEFALRDRARAVEDLCDSAPQRAADLAVELLRQHSGPSDWRDGAARDLLVSILVSRRSNAALPYVAERVRGSVQSVFEREEAILLLTELDGADVLDQLAELAPSCVRDQDRLPVARKLIESGDTRAGDIIAGWLAADRDRRTAWRDAEDNWMLRDLIELRHPAAASVLDDEMTRQRKRQRDASYQWAIRQASEIGDADAARLLATWVRDTELGTRDRLDAFSVLAAMRLPDALRGQLIREVLASPELSRPDREALEAALAPDPSPAEQLFLEQVRTRTELHLVHRLFRHRVRRLHRPIVSLNS